MQSRPRSHDAFNNSVWFSLSVGRNQSAEARWLLPTICRAGHITKNDVGAVRVQPDETFVEITEHAADLFLEALGPRAKLEKTIAVVRLTTPPTCHKNPARHAATPATAIARIRVPAQNAKAGEIGSLVVIMTLVKIMTHVTGTQRRRNNRAPRKKGIPKTSP